MSRSFSFKNGDVIVAVPEIGSSRLRAVELPLGSPNMNPSGGDFKPIRAVVNLGIEFENNPGHYPEELNQAVEIRVRYTPADLAAADRANKPLALGYWDGKTWIRFTREKHGFRLEADANPQRGGFGVITIRKWGDPPVGWGT